MAGGTCGGSLAVLAEQLSRLGHPAQTAEKPCTKLSLRCLPASLHVCSSLLMASNHVPKGLQLSPPSLDLSLNKFSLFRALPDRPRVDIRSEFRNLELEHGEREQFSLGGQN